MGLNFEYIEGQTPIDEDEKEGLLIDTLSTRGELNEFEQVNIQDAIEWTLDNKFNWNQIASEKFILEVHKKMFGQVWEWAGKYRKTNKNIGVDKYAIATEVKILFDDFRYWIENKTFEPDEIAVRFGHRLLQIHPFPNGNGRHSRLLADIVISHIFNRPVFTWGSTDLSVSGDLRRQYLQAIYSADDEDFEALLEFSRK